MKIRKNYINPLLPICSYNSYVNRDSPITSKITKASLAYGWVSLQSSLLASFSSSLHNHRSPLASSLNLLFVCSTIGVLHHLYYLLFYSSPRYFNSHKILITTKTLFISTTTYYFQVKCLFATTMIKTLFILLY